jgi:hypothetical protein
MFSRDQVIKPPIATNGNRMIKPRISSADLSTHPKPRLPIKAHIRTKVIQGRMPAAFICQTLGLLSVTEPLAVSKTSFYFNSIASLSPKQLFDQPAKQLTDR